MKLAFVAALLAGAMMVSACDDKEGTASSEATASADEAVVPPPCAEYAEAMETCEPIDPAVADNLLKKYDTVKASWMKGSRTKADNDSFAKVCALLKASLKPLCK